MLFMGTEKYPNENDFAEFLNKNAGWSNAYTDLDVTNYYFESSNESFLDSLDRFAQFFNKPLFQKSSVEREIMAVDSEHKKNLQSDLWRMMQLQRSETVETSLFNNFGTGDVNTLQKPDVRDQLIEFHKKYYSPSIMGLVLISNLTIEALEKIVDNLFSCIPKFDVKIPNYMEVDPFTSDNLGMLYKIVPVKSKDEMTINWYFKEAKGQNYKSEPMSYISNLLGHEGPNSLLSSLI